jgi:hypothetical protein
METKQLSRKVELVRIKLGFDNLFVVDCVGRSGGLALFWKLETPVQIQNYSRRHINAVINSGSVGEEWKFTGFYGHPDVIHRPASWALLHHLSEFAPEPWLCVGDFNEILSNFEKSNSSYRPPRQMLEFKQALADGNLADLGFVGPKFTWCNSRSGDDFIMERLYRTVANGG